MLDLRDAMNCLTLLRLRARCAEKESPYRIGIIAKDIRQTLTPYWKDTVVLFAPDQGGTYKIEIPMNAAEIKRETQKGSSRVTRCTCIGVPIEYISMVTLSDDDLPRPAAAQAA